MWLLQGRTSLTAGGRGVKFCGSVALLACSCMTVRCVFGYLVIFLKLLESLLKMVSSSVKFHYCNLLILRTYTKHIEFKLEEC